VLKAGSYALYLLAFFVLLALIKNRKAHHWAGDRLSIGHGLSGR
jgi:hypothetical protein